MRKFKRESEFPHVNLQVDLLFYLWQTRFQSSPIICPISQIRVLLSHKKIKITNWAEKQLDC